MALASHTAAARRRFEITGIVQGVGFRPFVGLLAARHDLAGHVRNTGAGVEVEVEGRDDALDLFAAALRDQAPAAAQVEHVDEVVLAPRGDSGFRIAASRPDGGAPAIGPDLASCPDCLRELFDPADRRYRYPFLTCTACGPRFTIVRELPYDRERTTLAGFPLCGDCRAEYEDPADRRFHAEAIACPACGPRLSMPLDTAVDVLCGGGILAVKGLGGWHLACLADDEAAVARLRARKGRDAKPFAVMTPAPDALVELEATERELLEGPARPIVLARRRAGAPVAGAVAPGSPWLGVLLPYTPLHHLLAGDVARPLVMTSGNRSDEPIATQDAEARARLGDVADAFLGHDRPIQRRCEDSVVRGGFPVRRSRGLAPAALGLPVGAARPLLAVGGQLKSTFCVAAGRRAWLSPHLGDLDTEAARRAFRDDLELYLGMLGVRPRLVAHDLHPDYASTAWAQDRTPSWSGSSTTTRMRPRAWPSTGARVPRWRSSSTGPASGRTARSGAGAAAVRPGLLRAGRPPGARAHCPAARRRSGSRGARAPRTSRRPAARPWERWTVVRQAMTVNAPLSSGMGRLFDAVAALLGVREHVTYEGQAAIELEQLAADVDAEPYPCRIEDGIVRGSDLVACAHDDAADGRALAEVAAAFHEGVAAAAAELCLQAAEPETVVLSGGTFQNLRLLRSVRARLTAMGFQVLSHRLVPANDGGLSFGQAAIAARRSSTCA
jgi:hydrogenase maturation protein HypF